MNGSRLHRLLLSGALALLVAGASACGVPTDDTPRPLGDETSTTSPAGVDPAGNTTPVYLAGGDAQLVRSSRPVIDRSPQAALEALLMPITDNERALGLNSNIPPGTTVLGVESVEGTVTVNFSTEWGAQADPTALPAYGQVVLTLTALPGVEAVRFQIDGTPVATPPTVSNDPKETVTAADYAELEAN